MITIVFKGWITQKVERMRQVLSLQNTLIVGIPFWIQRIIFGLIVNRASKKGTYAELEKYTGRP
ncbi:hypothetical protein QNH28_24220 [Paenibacillus sp. G2S3]|uniref:hypothetical protein n=1 Tax=Paenibacillus sp. G2S3 TaxID=3047872 RepID=UPI0024C1A4D9|nr:hypothetical protein [Paenibacillus sp. G2S3]WHY18540.1 hypothetical protein QNH28_24220 [Paenibacillus sp. G2S3]